MYGRFVVREYCVGLPERCTMESFTHALPEEVLERMASTVRERVLNTYRVSGLSLGVGVQYNVSVGTTKVF